MGDPRPGRRWRSALAVTLVLLAWGGALLPATAQGASSSSLQVQATGAPTTGRGPLMVAFTATAAGGIGPYTYVWTFGDGASAAYGPSVNHTFLVVGTYRAVVNVTDSFGEPGNASVVITVAPPVLSVVLTATPSSLAAGAPTSLEANATGGTPPYAYEWTGMPAGCVGGNLASIRCVPSGPGGYTIRVNVTDTLGGSASSFVGLVVSGASGGGGAGANSLSTLQLAGIVSIVAAAGIAGGVGGSWLRRRWRRSR